MSVCINNRQKKDGCILEGSLDLVLIAGLITPPILA